MLTSIAQFREIWQGESAATARILEALTDASLAQRVTPRDRSLGEIAWHTATSIPEMADRTGLRVAGRDRHAATPVSAATIRDAYARSAADLLERVSAGWTDDTLRVEDDMYGEPWPRGLTLQALVLHEVHHRGQITVLMRQAGLAVPGVYGPNREEMEAMRA
ncbi:MAG TPA: DinB family protein [Thermoanaerobaculaceae bacterium]|nr:DinB family protein [Thermoanaerobaculaceae bacterium]